ncbi:MAG: hypothetical protein ACJ77N_11610 [Chloroflexota bacterium]|jgi:hypothetical protein
MEEGDGDFRATTDHMLTLLDQLKSIEMQKRAVPVGSEAFVQLAADAERVSRLVFRWSGMQLQMAERAPRAVELGDLSGAPLIEVEPRPLDRILASWREAQLRLEMAKPGSTEAEAASDDVERLREEFQAHEALRRRQAVE